MRNITVLRRAIAEIHHLRRASIVAIDNRDETMLRNKLTAMRRKIDAMEAMIK